MSDPICDIVEVTAEGAIDTLESVAHVVDVAGSGDVDVTQIIGQVVDVAGVGDAAAFDIPQDLVIAAGIGQITLFSHLSAANLVSVTGRGTVSTHERIRHNVDVAGVGTVDVLQTSVREIVQIAAQGAITVFQKRISHQLVSVGGKGRVSVFEMAREIVDVTAEGVVAVLDHLLARSLVDVAGIGSVSLYQGGTFRDFIEIHGGGHITVFDHLHAIDTVTVEGDGDVALSELINDVAPPVSTLAWSAPTDGFGMSEHDYPRAITGLVEFDGVPLAVGPEGAYLILAADDVGADIDAFVKSALYDGGDAFLKRGLAVYVTYTSDKPIGLSVGTPQSGAEVTYDYVGTVPAQSAPRPVRVQIGKGIRSRMLRFTIRNTEGGGLTVLYAEPDTFDTGRRT